MKVAVQIKALLLAILSSLAYTATAAPQPLCQSKSLKTTAKAILLAAESGSSAPAIAPQDRRIKVADLRPGSGITLEAVEAARIAAESSVEIADVTLNGERLNDFESTGFMIGTKCHVLTVRHGVNKGQVIKSEKYGADIKMDWDHSPVGASVKVTHGLLERGTSASKYGKVVAVGERINGVAGDWALIRLDSPTALVRPTVFTSDDPSTSEFIGIPLMLIGLPFDKAGNSGQKQLIVDPSCSSVRKGSESTGKLGISTNCLATNGNSGGPVIGKVAVENGKEKWGLIGMLTNGDVGSTLTGKRSGTLGNGVILDLDSFIGELSFHLKKDLKSSPCR